MQERIRNSPLDIASAEKSGGDGLNELIGSYFERVCGGEPAETVIRGIWISHFKGDIPLDQARNLVGGLFDKHYQRKFKKRLKSHYMELD